MERKLPMTMPSLVCALLLTAGCTRGNQPARLPEEDSTTPKRILIGQNLPGQVKGTDRREPHSQPQSGKGIFVDSQLPLAHPPVGPFQGRTGQSVTQFPAFVAPSSSPKADAALAAASRSQPKGAKKQEADAIFDKPSLLRIRIEIPPSGMILLRRTRAGATHKNRPVVRATVYEGGSIYTNVAIHLKGTGSFRAVDGKPALTLNFNKFAPGQNFHGLHKLSLNNSVQDPTYLAEKIARELFLAAGVPTPRASHATVEFNGRNLGLYVLLEGANQQFLKRYFDNPKGNLYDGGFCRDINSQLSVNCGEDPKNNNDLHALRAAVRAGNYRGLENALDMDRFISMLALEWMLGHGDGYTQNRNNWRVFDNLDSKRMVFIPHGMDRCSFGEPDTDGIDQMLGTERLDILPGNVKGEVSRLVLASPEGRQRYRDRVKQIYTNVFKVDEIAAEVDEIATNVSTALAQTDPRAASCFQERADAFKERIIRRAKSLHPLLGEPSYLLRPGVTNSIGEGEFVRFPMKRRLPSNSAP